MKNTLYHGGICPLPKSGHGKLPTMDKPIEDYVAETVHIPMAMHVGTPCKPCVAKGDYVKLGQVIGEPTDDWGIPVHASVSGEVLAVEPISFLFASPVACVVIKNDFTDTWAEDVVPLGDVETVDKDKIIPAVKAAGICGLGGATFPTHVKLTVPAGKSCDTIIVNGAECEAFLTVDGRLMQETPKRVVDGLRAAMRATGAEKGIIGVEDNKPKAIEALKQACQGRQGVSVVQLPTCYAQGCEKQLIYAVTKRQVPSGKLPLDTHTIVLNAGTAAAIADAIQEGKPLITRTVTVTGEVANPTNLRVRVGTTFQDAIDHCGGFTKEPGKIVSGGGMMGVAIPDTHMPMTKSSNGIIVFGEEASVIPPETACIRCGRCAAACPTALQPYQLRTYCDRGNMEGLEEYHLMDCIGCGSCTYVCPSKRILAATFKNMKAKITAEKQGGAKE